MANKELPGYQRSSAAQPLGQANNAGYQRVSQALNSFNQNLASVGKGIAETKAKEAGELAGRDPNFEPSMPITGPDRIFREAAIQTNRVMVSTDIAQNVERIKADVLTPGRLNTGSVEEFNKISSGYAEGVLQGVPSYNREYAEDVLKNTLFSAEQDVQNKVFQLNHNELNAKFRTYSLETARQIDLLAGQGRYEEAEKLKQEYYAANASALASGQITPEFASAALDGIRYDSRTSGYLGEYSRRYSEDPKEANEWAKSILNQDNEMTIVEKMALLNKFGEYESVAKISKGVETFEIKQAQKNVLDSMEAGATLSSMTDAIAKIKAANPKDYDEFWNKAQESDYIGSLVRQGKFTSQAGRKAILDYLKDIEGQPPEVAGVKARAYKAVESQFNKLDRDLNADPAAYAQSAPQYKSELEKRDLKDPDADPDSVSLEIQRQLLVPKDKRSILGAAEAGEFVNRISGLRVNEQFAALTELLDSHPKTSDIVLRDLEKAGMPFASELLIRISQNPLTVGESAMVMQAMSADLKELEAAAAPDEVKKTELKNKITEEIYTALGASFRYDNLDRTKVINKYSDAIYRLALYAGQKTGNTKEALKKAVDIVIDKQFDFFRYNGELSFTGLEDIPVGGTSILRVPKGMPRGPVLDGATRLFKSITHEKLRVPPSYLRVRTPEEAQEDYKADLFDNGHVTTRGDNQGLILIDAYGNPVLKENGSRFEVDYDTLVNPLTVEGDDGE